MTEPIKLVPKLQSAINDDIVAVLEGALNKARAGQFEGLAIVASLKEGGHYSTFSADADRMKMVGMLDFVKFRMMRQTDDDL